MTKEPWDKFKMYNIRIKKPKIAKKINTYQDAKYLCCNIFRTGEHMHPHSEVERVL